MPDGWFSAFREDFAPTSYGTINNPCVNVRTIIVFLAFAIPYLAFLLVFPGLREKRIVSFATITIQIGVGVLLIGSLVLPYWSVGSAIIISQFTSHTSSRHESKIGIRIGLTAINVTLRYIKPVDDKLSIYDGIYYNERYSLEGVKSMADELVDAYYDGLPYPMLKLLEYFSLSQDAFAWGKQYRNSGYFASALVWASFITWAWQCILLAFLPHHYAKLGILCGFIAIVADFVYMFLSPKGPEIPFTSPTHETVKLSLSFGSSFYMCLCAGLISLAYGIALTVLQYLRIYTLSTCMSSSLDSTVGPRCRYGRELDGCLDGPPHPSSSCSEVSTSYIHDETSSDGKRLEMTRHPNHNSAKTSNKSKISPTQTGNSSGFQSGSSLRSSTNSTLSSSSRSAGIQRTLSTDTIGHSNLTDDDDPPTANRSPALSSIAERHYFAHPN